MTSPRAVAPATFTRRLATVFEMIKIEHTLFALPFALLGMVLAADGWPTGPTLGWIVVAMVGARSAAMAFNRLVDRQIDAANPRTQGRAIPAGQLTPTFVALFVLASSALLVVAAWQLNPLALALSPVALGVLLLYSYSKRFTSLCHLILGLALAGAPLGAWIAVRGDLTVTPVCLGAAVLCWVAGFDILYALQDQEFDRHSGLHSIPARWGTKGALWISAALHAVMLGLLALLPSIYPPGLGIGYWVGWLGCLLLLSYQHWIVRPHDLSRLDAAFFTANGVLSLWLFVATSVDVGLIA
ncbi:MAG: putative 4-hydroxybenzoate polyprenyltransferase [Thermoanaerobaculia bacterium]|nr:putative 4-hydroxybenzoate polyprenyltransferase [Thermoanaerobaculia bacterium]